MNEQLENIYLGIVIILCIGVLVFFLYLLIVSANTTSEDYNNQCKDLGYNEYIRDGGGGFCVGDESSIQVILNKGKVIPIEK